MAKIILVAVIALLFQVSSDGASLRLETVSSLESELGLISDQVAGLYELVLNAGVPLEEIVSQLKVLNSTREEIKQRQDVLKAEEMEAFFLEPPSEETFEASKEADSNHEKNSESPEDTSDNHEAEFARSFKLAYNIKQSDTLEFVSLFESLDKLTTVQAVQAEQMKRVRENLEEKENQPTILKRTDTTLNSGMRTRRKVLSQNKR